MKRETLHEFRKKYKRSLSRELRLFIQSLILRGPGEWNKWKIFFVQKISAREILYKIESPYKEEFYPIYDTLKKQIIDFKF